VLTPEVVKEDDFYNTNHLTTMVVIIPQSNVETFMKTYETYSENVVPQSAREFASVRQEDGTQIWRVVMFKSSVEAFMKKAREERQCTCRPFEFSQQAYEKVKKQREELKKEVDRQDKMMKGFCKASLSDVMIAWVHIKAMRIFVESVLRFGVPPNFASFIVQPKGNQQVNMRKALADILGKGTPDTMADAAGAEDEDYFPYVSLSFTPFTVNKGY